MQSNQEHRGDADSGIHGAQAAGPTDVAPVESFPASSVADPVLSGTPTPQRPQAQRKEKFLEEEVEDDVRSADDLLEEEEEVIATDRNDEVAHSRGGMSHEELEGYIADIAETVKIGLEQSISILTPWFFKNMPTIYYQTTPRAEKIRHLSAVITGHVFETKQTVDLWNRDKSKVTHIGPGGHSEVLSAMARKISRLDLKMGSIYFSKDKLLFLSTFYTRQFKPLDLSNRHISFKLSLSRKILQDEFVDEKASIQRFLESLDNDFVTSSTEAHIRLTYRMVRHMERHEGAHTFFEARESSLKRGRITIGVKDVGIGEIYEAVLALIHRKFRILRNFNVRLEKGYENPIVVMLFEIQHKQGRKIEVKGRDMQGLTKALRTLGWVDNDDYNQFMQEPFHFSINAANLMRAMAAWTHVQLSKENAYYYSEYKIFHTLRTHEEITKGILNLFRHRFDHSIHNGEESEKVYHAKKESLEDQIDGIIDQVCRKIFSCCVSFLHHTLKTNYFLPTKTGLSFRLDPDILNAEYYPEKPFGIFYVMGRDYRFFQVRWKDISRGGVRVIMPKNRTGYSHDLSSLFDEVYDLSYAQQMKNKDIPEGGSKAVALVRPGGRLRVVRGAVNALLDLLVESDESYEERSSELLKYYTQDEIIYLGPDENMTNELITWITHQAERRGYRYARAFMSSKPGDGINHKEYGVTSEGLNVFLDHTLRYLGIDPHTDTFSVKMTGGPSGDVAGNELKILHREYGENVRVVVISDGSGAAHDPEGLNWQELMRLFGEQLPICEFNPQRLSSSAEAFVIDASTADHVRRREESYRKIYADVFVPAGGRPYSVTKKNWRSFLREDGSLTCRAVVEGANIFFTEEAREELQKAGAVIIKDSSANKAGVICSSYETVGSSILSTEEFRSLKDLYVEQIIAKLHQKAAEEAHLLFEEYDRYGGKVLFSTLSKRISEAINSIKDLLIVEMTQRCEFYLKDQLFQDCLISHLPQVLVEQFPERIQELPTAYQIATVATVMANRVVYREGIDWLNSLPLSQRVEACRIYLKNEKQKQSLIDAVQESKIHDKEQIMVILQNYAARELTVFDLQKSRSSIRSVSSKPPEKPVDAVQQASAEEMREPSEEQQRESDVAPLVQGNSA